MTPAFVALWLTLGFLGTLAIMLRRMHATATRQLHEGATRQQEILDKRLVRQQELLDERLVRQQEILDERLARVQLATNVVYNGFAALQKKQRAFQVLGEDQLALEEAEAAEVWVVTARLDKDTAVSGPIHNAVLANLRRGVRYSYFLPNPKNRRHKIAHEHLNELLSFPAVKRHLAQIRVFNLPEDYFFSTTEIVLHNPLRRNMRGAEAQPAMFYYVDPQGTELVRAPDKHADWFVEELDSFMNVESLASACFRLAAQYSQQLDVASLAALHHFGRQEPPPHANDLDTLVESMRERRRNGAEIRPAAIEAIFADLSKRFPPAPTVAEDTVADDGVSQ